MVGGGASVVLLNGKRTTGPQPELRRQGCRAQVGEGSLRIAAAWATGQACCTRQARQSVQPAGAVSQPVHSPRDSEFSKFPGFAGLAWRHSLPAGGDGQGLLMANSRLATTPQCCAALGTTAPQQLVLGI